MRLFLFTTALSLTLVNVSAHAIEDSKARPSQNIEDRRTSYAEKVLVFFRNGDSFAAQQDSYQKLSASNECALSKREANLATDFNRYYKSGRESDKSVDKIRKLDFAPGNNPEVGADACGGAFDKQREAIDSQLERIEAALPEFNKSFYDSALLASDLFGRLSENNGHWRPICAALRKKASQPPKDFILAYKDIVDSLELEKNFLEQASLKLAAAKSNAHCGSLKSNAKASPKKASKKK